MSETIIKTIPYPANKAWEDLRFPAQGINPPGQASDPSVEATTGMLLFSNTQDNIIAGVAQLPHAWKEDSVIKPHVHWEKTTSAAGAVAWVLEYKWYGVGETAPENYTSLGIAGTPVSDENTANRHALSAWAGISGLGKKISSIVMWTLKRDVSEDSYAAPVRFIEFDIHYQVDAFGSTTNEYTK